MTPAPVIFDCDGLLVDTHGHWDRAYHALFTRYGVHLGREDRRRLVGLRLADLGHALDDLLGHPVPPHVLAQQIRELVATNTGTEVTRLPGARELVTAVAGTRPMAVASNSPAEIVRDYLHATGIPDVFDTIIGAGDTDHPKPAPDLYQEACRRLGVPCTAVVVLEDSLIGVQAARAAGATVFAIPDLPQTRPVAHLSFPSLADPALWQALDLTVPPGTVPQPRQAQAGAHADRENDTPWPNFSSPAMAKPIATSTAPSAVPSPASASPTTDAYSPRNSAPRSEPGTHPSLQRPDQHPRPPPRTAHPHR